MPRERPIARIGGVDAVGKQAAVFRVHDKEEPVEEHEAVLLAQRKVGRGIKAVGLVLDESLDAKPQRLENALLQLLADAERVLGTAFYGSND